MDLANMRLDRLAGREIREKRRARSGKSAGRREVQIEIFQSPISEEGSVSNLRFQVSTTSAVAVLAAVLVVIVGATLPLSYLAASREVGASLSELLLRSGTIAKRLGETLFVAARTPAPALLVALILERWVPVSRLQRDLTRGFGQDLMWYLTNFLRTVSWMPLYLALLVSIKVHLIGTFALIPGGALPATVEWTLAVLAWDLLSYLSHVLRHRVDFLWNFHAIHHSQKEMNFFTQYRFHDVDVLVDQAIRNLPLLALNASWLALGIFYVVSEIHFQLYHSSIRTNYGLMRYVLVTPQSHRVHHARDPRQQNSNYGVFFSFWDIVFRTQYANRDEYPEELGIEDPRFPIEQGTSLRDIPRVYAAQLLYPFMQSLTQFHSERKAL